MLLAPTLVLSGCAITHVHADGTIEYWGVARVVLPAAQTRPSVMRISIDGIGLLMMTSPAGGTAALGYASQTLTVLGDNAMACFPPTGPSAKLPRPAAPSP
jgi:hypothetical protein